MKTRCAFHPNTQSHPMTSTWSTTKPSTLYQINVNPFRTNMLLSQKDL